MSPVSESVRIGILGDFNPEFRSHHATNDSLQHAARKLQLKVTCGGFQYALIECARNVLGIHDATTAEEEPKAKNIVIYPVACAIPTKDPKAPKLSGKVKQIHLRPGSYLAAYYGKEMIEEEFFCNYEMNPEFEWMAMEAGFPVVARGSKEECRAIESPAHLFYVATLFQPQLSSTEANPHPLIMAFVQHVADFRRKRLDDSILA